MLRLEAGPLECALFIGGFVFVVFLVVSFDFLICKYRGSKTSGKAESSTNRGSSGGRVFYPPVPKHRAQQSAGRGTNVIG